MTNGFDEPTTDAEAHEIERFLELGAETAIEILEAFEARAPAEAAVNQPALIEFDVTLRDLVALLAESDRRQARLAIEVEDVREPKQFFAVLFINNPEATSRTLAEDPSFVGPLGFFLDAEHPVEPSHDGLRYELDLTDRLQQIEQSAEPVTASVVIVPFGDEFQELPGLFVRAATVSVIESIVEPLF